MGHTMLMETLIDTDLLKHEKIWAAAGTPNALFCLTPEELRAMTKGRVVSIT
jgi:prolyl-tRNA editing enzyme YbaK/EbsC (Cys-tRNA(Pro) deacylase)